VVRICVHQCVSRKAGVGTMMLRTVERSHRGAIWKAGAHQAGAVGVEAVAGTATVPAAANGLPENRKPCIVAIGTSGADALWRGPSAADVFHEFDRGPMDRNSLDADKNWIKDLPAVWKLRLLPVTNVVRNAGGPCCAGGRGGGGAGGGALVEAGALGPACRTENGCAG
jgi:hypothetical protein